MAVFTKAQQVNSVFFNWNNGNSNYPGYMLAENIAQENNGILWLGGREGLLRFDGRHFQPFTYSVNDSNSLPGNYIAAQYISGNTLYGGCFGSGFFTMDLKSLNVKRIALFGPEFKNKLSVTSIVPKGADSLWLAVSDKQLICVDRINFKQRENFFLSPLPGHQKNNEIILDIIPSRFKKNKIWLLCSKAILLADIVTGKYQSFTFSIDNGTTKKIGLQKPTQIIEETDSTAVVSFFENGLIKWNFKINSWQHFTYNVNAPRIQNNSINDIIEKSPRAYFVSGSDSGLYIFNSATEKFTREYNPYRIAPTVFKNPTRQLFKDKHGGIWITMIGGISYWHPQYQGVLAFSMPPNVQPTVASSVQNIGDDILITRRDKQIPLILFSKKQQQWKIPEKNVLVNDYIRQKSVWENNYLYKSVSDKWFTYDIEAHQLKTWLPPFFLRSMQAVQSVTENSQYFVYNLADTIIIYNKQTGRSDMHGYADKPDSLHSKRCFTSLFDRYNNLWIATSTGLSVYSIYEKKFKEISFRTDKSLEGLETVTDIKLSANGLIYVGTQQSGIFVFNCKTKNIQAHYNKDNLLAENFVHNLLFDSSENNLVVSTLSGITVINLKNRIAHRWDKYNSGLQIEDGFFGMSLSDNNELYTGDSVLYQFSIYGFIKKDIQPFVSGYMANKKYFNGTSSIQLNAETNYIELFLSTGFFADNAHSKFQYRFHQQEEWNSADNGKIIIPDLNNGKTTLQIRAILQGVIQGEGEKTITIKRQLFYYQTLLFKGALAALLLGILLLSFKKRINRVRKQEQEKALLQHKIDQLETASLRSQMNPHFIFNTLSSLRYLVLMGDNKNASNYILKLSKLLRMIITHSREHEIPLQDELDFLCLYLEIESLRFDNGFSFTIKVDAAADIFDLRIPPMLLQPFVENAIKHGLANSMAAEKWVNIAVSKLKEGGYLFAIIDNGIGRENAAALHKQSDHQSLGTEITNERITLFNRTSHAKIYYTIEDYSKDEENSGTAVKIFYEPVTNDESSSHRLNK